MKKAAKGFAMGAIVAGVAGYVAGVLTAPKSGKETRQDIKEGVSRTLAQAEAELKKLHTQLNSVIDEAKLRAGKLSDSAQEQLSALVEKAKEAKEKVRVMLSAIHEGDADDKDLQKAISEANSALEHLKDYLKK